MVIKIKENLHLPPKTLFIRNKEITNYRIEIPFDPPKAYPELSFIKKNNKNNLVYEMVRNLFKKLAMDKKNIGTPQWNPFKDIVKPGDKVLIKPNLITHRHYLGNYALYSTVAHGAVLRPFLDYISLALEGSGSIIIADNPIVGTDFKCLMDFTGIEAMVNKLINRGYKNLEVIDLRPKILKEENDGTFNYEEQKGDPLGYVDVDIGKDSLFYEFDSNPNIHYYTLADPTVDHIDPDFKGRSETDNYHNPLTHKYTISKTVLNADLIINVAKMKTHCKAGVTLTLKNMIGSVYGKSCMPHWRKGLPPDGDASPYYPPSYYNFLQKAYIKLRKWLRVHRYPGFNYARNYLQGKNILFGQFKHLGHGNWKGNDTLWRTILDLNRIIVYSDKNGEMHDVPQRKYLAFIDGIMAQQGEGPMCGEPLNTSIIFGGYNPVLVDALAVKSMGIDYKMIKTISKANVIEKWKLLPDEPIDLSFPDIDVPVFNFKMPKGWK